MAPKYTQEYLAEFAKGHPEFMDKYSRMIAAYGLSAVIDLMKMKILVVGMSGVGIEVAKNTVLAGVSTMTLHDNKPAQISDLGSNFFITEQDLGQPRASICAPRLQELNDTCMVTSTSPDLPLSENIVKEHGLVVFTEGSQAELIRWNNFCRTQEPPISFISVKTSSCFGSTFVDHGDSHTVTDRDGKAPLIRLTADQVNPAREVFSTHKDDDGKEYTLVTFMTPSGQTPGSFPDNCLVTFSDVLKKTESGASEPHEINEMGPLRLYKKSGDPANAARLAVHTEGSNDKDADGNYTPLMGLASALEGGMITETKEPWTIQFKSLEECITNPGCLRMDASMPAGIAMTDMTFTNKEFNLHAAYQGVYQFEAQHGHLPEANNKPDAQECVALAKTFWDGHLKELCYGADLNEGLCYKVAIHADVELQPVAAFWGGVVSQEIVKNTGKYSPIWQYLNVSCEKALPTEMPTDTDPIGSRYDNMAAIYGRSFVEKLGELNIFMVGCGALGCEYVKNFALNGVCCGPHGKLTITDNDRIEVSNLNRQFLFRSDNVGQAKSAAAEQRASLMNPNIKINPLQEFVGGSTEHIFDDRFWNGLDLVTNALDNMEARVYVDRRCVTFEKPLLESGTMGTGANVDVVVPHLTQSYEDGGTADEGGGVPMCTLRNFPHLIDHCIEWARAMFEDSFTVPAKQAMTFLDDAPAYIANIEASTAGNATKMQQQIQVLQKVKATVARAAANPTMKDCVEMALATFYHLFRDKIMDLTDLFPADKLNKDGSAYWSGHKIFPNVVEYDATNEMHVSFMVNASNLYASVLGLHGAKPPPEVELEGGLQWQHGTRSDEWLASMIKDIATPARETGNVEGLEGDDAEAQVSKSDADVETQLKGLCNELLGLAEKMKDQAPLQPAKFEKDDDDNFHIDFITSCSNLRAFNYHIQPARRDKCKVIAGKIIPAIATTTAAVCGLVMLEMFKVLQGRGVEDMQNGNFDLGSNSYTFFEATNPRAIKPQERPQTDQIEKAMTDTPEYFDEKGNLLEDYKEFFYETVDVFPNPHNKWDKYFLEGLADATLGELIAAVNKKLKDEGAPEGTVVDLVSGPITDGHSQFLYSPLAAATKPNLAKKWTQILKDEHNVDPASNDIFRPSQETMTIAITNEEGFEVNTPPFLIKMNSASNFASYSDQRMQRGWQPAPWMECVALRRQVASLESFIMDLSERLRTVEATHHNSK